MIAALALVLGLSQCKKQEAPVANGQKQHIVLTADNGNDGSKVSADFVSANLNLTWDGDEVITVSGGAKGTLDKITVDQSNPSKATFEGDIEIIDKSKLLEFTVGGTPNYEGQPGTEDGCEGWIKNNISLTGTDDYDPQGQYSADMKLPYAVLKLDVSALGTSGKLEIKVGETLVASVTDVSAPKAVFVAVPADGNEKEYKISIGDKTATKTWPLLPNTFYTKSDGTGGGTGDAIVIEPATPTTPKFTVDANGTTVEFSKGNLWYGTEDDAKPQEKAFHFEENQWSFASTWNSSHVSHFLWSPDKGIAVGTSTSVSGSTSDVFFTNATQATANPGFQVDGETGTNQWRTLSNAEWNHLLNIRTMTYDKPRYTNKTAGIVIGSTTYNGIFIYPDDYNGNQVGSEGPSNWADINNAGIVFLPAAGSRWGTTVDDVGSDGYFWSSTPHVGNGGYAYRMYFNSGSVSTKAVSRSYGHPVRLVRDVK